MASGLYSQADDWMRKKGEQYVQDLKSNRAKRNFRNMAGEYITQQGHANSRFEAAQIKHYKTEQADAAIKNSLNSIEKNFNNPELINLERVNIRQALELKMRGSGLDAFNDAYAQIEDQIGIARIRQAYAQHPLYAVAMLEDPDIHLKPETQAKLRESLGNKTEVYKLQAIASAYAQHYTPEKAQEAYNAIIQRYGPDTGQKAYSALTHMWSIANTQQSAIEKRTSDAQRKNADTFLTRFLDPNASRPTKLEVQACLQFGGLTPQAAKYLIDYIDALDKADSKAQKEQYERMLITYAKNGTHLQHDQIVQLYSQGSISKSVMDELLDEPARQEASEQQNLLKAQRINEDNFYLRILNNDPNDKVSVDDIRLAAESRFIRPEKADAFMKVIEARQKEQELNEHSRREREIIADAENGTFPPDEELQNRFVSGELSPGTYEKVKRERDKRDAQNAKSEQARHKNELDELAFNLSRAYPIGSRQQFNDWLNYNNDYSPEDREYIRSKYLQHIQDQNQAEQERLQLHKELHERTFKLIRMSAEDEDDPHHLPLIQRKQMLIDGDLTQEEFDILKRAEEKDIARKAKANEALLKQTREQNEHDLWIDALKGIHKTQDELIELADKNAISMASYNQLLEVKRKQDKAREEAELELWKDNMFEKAKDLAERFPLGSQQDAYAELDNYSRTERSQIKSFYDAFIQEQNIARQNQDKALRDQQEQTFNSLHEYWKGSNPVPVDVLRRLLDDNKLTQEQVDKAKIINAKLAERSGVEESLVREMGDEFTSLSRAKQEELIMRNMGVNEAIHEQTVRTLFGQVLDGSITDAAIDWAFAHGRITADDKDRLKAYDSKFEREQKAVLNNLARQLIMDIKSAGIRKNSSYYENMALTDFYRMTSTIDLHAKNFNDIVSSMYETVRRNALEAYGETITKSQGLILTGPTPAENRRQNALNRPVNPPQPNPQLYYNRMGQDNGFVLNSSGDTPAPNISPQAADTLQGVVDTTKSIIGNVAYRVSSGFSWAKTKLRNGRAHPSVDLAVPVGTEVHVPNYGSQWTVSGTGQNSTAGKFVKISTVLASGDKHEITFAHLDKINVADGDVVVPADVVAKSGNTGHSTGPHLHVNLKVNGKSVDPRSVDVGTSSSDVRVPQTAPASPDIPAIPQPQPLVPPILSSDEEMQKRVREFFFGSDFFNSQDISTLIPYGGY